MTVENIERLYVCPVLEYGLIMQLISDNDWTLVSESTMCFIFEKCTRSHIDVAVKEGGEQE